MADNFIAKEVDRIITDLDGQFPLNIAMSAAWIMANFKGMNIKIYDVNNSSSLADYYIVGSANNPTQARAMVDEIMVNLKRHKAITISTEGLDSADWVLLDMGDIIIHIFQENTREVYDLDGLWRIHDQVQIPSEYYYSNSDSGSNSNDDTNNYF